MGIKKRKADIQIMGRMRWKVKFHGAGRKRGRPILADDQLTSEKYKEKRRLKQQFELFKATLGYTQGTLEYKRWRKEELRLKKSMKIKDRLRLGDIREVSKKVYKKTKAATRILPKHLRVNPMKSTTLCGVKGCENEGTVEARNCCRNTMRCEHLDHKFIKCIGKRTWCKCAVERNNDSEDDIVVDKTIIRVETEEGWIEGVMRSIHQRRIGKKHQTVYQLEPAGKPEERISFGNKGEDPLETFRWWIVGEIEDEGSDSNSKSVGESQRSIHHQAPRKPLRSGRHSRG